MFGGDSLHELRVCLQLAEEQVHGGLSPRVSPFVQTSDVGSVLSRGGFKLTTIDTDRLTVKFEDMFQLLRFLQATGENNANCLRGGYFGKEAFQLASELYRQQYSDDEGYIFASIHVVYMIGWSPHPDQQQPKKRGLIRSHQIIEELKNRIEFFKKYLLDTFTQKYDGSVSIHLKIVFLSG
ncbi:NADH dehydrogenase [ubiquinone] 1 alpha subcomplex assembly factor 5 [Galdieria sulphuraria]|nr:NADH dehydrogenase [ubiquinone] 1 alpha subcomplex assembly factor 5 [Galdieria sulphuraria]